MPDHYHEEVETHALVDSLCAGFACAQSSYPENLPATSPSEFIEIVLIES